MLLYRNIEIFNNAYSDKPIFIIGAGPSIAHQDLSVLKNHIVIAVNGGYLAYKNADFFVSDDESIWQWSYFFNDLKKSNHTKVLLYEDKLIDHYDKFNDRSYLFKHRTGYNLTETYSNNDYDNHICQSSTSIGSAMHISYTMGCRNIVLLGVDCCYYKSIRYFWDIKTKFKPYLLNEKYRKIFTPKIYKNTVLDLDLYNLLQYWKNVYKIFNDKCNVYNASPLSILDGFKKVKLIDMV